MLYFIIIGCFFFSMILFPSFTLEGACNGLLLWFQTVLPTLLPFVIVSNILINTNGVYFITQRIGWLFQHIFGVSQSGSYPILIGFLCGYPMGAKTIADLVKAHSLSKNEGQYLLSFCNNTSPMFIVGYLVIQNLQDNSLIVPCLLILFAAPIICSFLFRVFYKTKYSQITQTTFQKPAISFDFLLLDTAIMNGFETLTRIGGYIILFSILVSLMKNLPFSVLIALFEITNGIPYILDTAFSSEIKFALILGLTAFGGFCSIAQTQSMIQDSGLSIRPYIKEKLITAMVTSFIAYIYILFIH